VLNPLAWLPSKTNRVTVKAKCHLANEKGPKQLDKLLINYD